MRQIISKTSIDIKRLDKINEGIMNHNFLIETNICKFFLKKYSSDLSISKIEYIKKIEDFMFNNNIPAIKAIINNKKYKMSLYPFIESNRSHNYNYKDYYLMGQMLAKIHKVSFNKNLSEEFKKNKFKDKFLINNNGVFAKYINIINNKDKPTKLDLIYKKYLEKKLKYSNSFKYEQEVKNDTIIHGDYHPGNLFFNKNKTKIIGICDWEKSIYGPRSYDFAKAYINLSFGSGEENIDICIKIKKKLREGYRSILKLSNKEIEDGIKLRIKDFLANSFLEDRYFLYNDVRSNKFVKNWIRILDYFCQKNLF